MTGGVHTANWWEMMGSQSFDWRSGGVYDWRGVHSKLVENDGESIL